MHPSSGDGQSEFPMTVLAVDPGREKCGIAIVRSHPLITLARRVVPTERLIVEASSALREFPDVQTLVIGDGTASGRLRKAIAAAFPHLSVKVVDEHGSSIRARRLYIETHPPRGWQRLLPASLRVPSEPYDDLVAEILAKDFFQQP
jgi:RNase H-fold protein (predicted Holliday junction resolvase)